MRSDVQRNVSQVWRKGSNGTARIWSVEMLGYWLTDRLRRSTGG